jgi:uncharacterized protein (DUF433 family)/DNA-binding transcriptional MerR regulator
MMVPIMGESAEFGDSVNEVVARFTAKQAARLTGLPQQTLSYWVRHVVITPAYRDDSGWLGVHYLFSFQDLVTLRTMRLLREKRVPLQAIRWAAMTLQHYFGQSWTTLRLRFYGKNVGFFDPLTNDFVSTSQPGQKVAEEFVELEPLRLEMQAKVEDFDRRKPEEIGTFTRDRAIMGGQWVIAGTRIPPSAVYEYVLAGCGMDEIRDAYPSLDPLDIEAAIAYEEQRLTASRKLA